MVDMTSVPSRVMEMLEIFLAASSRGKKAVIVLETRMKTVNIKYRSVDTVAGAPATTDTSATPSIKRKITPARARRSKLRLEEFIRKKQGETASSDHQQTGENNEVGSQAAGNTSSITSGRTAGDTSSATNKLVIELPNTVEQDRPVETIPQVDGQEEGVQAQGEDKVTYTFVSNFGEEDILYALTEVFPQTEKTETKLVSRIRLRPLGAHHMCTVTVKQAGGQISWPEMEPSLAEVFQDLKRIKL